MASGDKVLEIKRGATKAEKIQRAQSILACYDDVFLSKEEFELKKNFDNGQYGHMLKERIKFAEGNVAAKNLPHLSTSQPPHFLAKKEGFRPVVHFLKISEVINLRLVNQRMSNYMLVQSTTHIMDWGLSHHFVSFYF